MSYRSIFRQNLFSGQVIVVTGGGSGIGRCTAHELSALGARLVLVGRTLEKLQEVVREIDDSGGYAACYALDIREEDSVRRVVREILETQGIISALVNNAGGQFPAPLGDLSQKGFETVLRTNLVGGFMMARELYNRCFQSHGGAIVNIVADYDRGMPGMGHSGAARAGMVNFTRTAAVEWAPSGVRVNAVAPGWIASSGLDRYQGAARALIPRLRKAVPLKRLGTESEISAAICFLLSEAAAFITGAVLHVDGGAPLASHLWPMMDHGRSRPFEGFHLAKRPKVLDEEPDPSDQ